MNKRASMKLAKAMGWKLEENHGFCQWQDPQGNMVGGISSRQDHQPPPINPFTDANDDYAVLEWMRENWQEKDGHYGHWHEAAQSLWWRWDEYSVDVPYRIGNYARAACAELEIECP